MKRMLPFNRHFIMLSFTVSHIALPSVRSFSVVVRRPLTSLLTDPSLIQQQPQQYESSSDGRVFPVLDPASPDSVIAEVSVQNGEDARKTIAKCHEALPSWRDDTTAVHRATLLTKWSNLVQENAEDLAIIMTLESGKSLTESRGEVQYAKSFLDYFAAEAVRSTGAGGGFLVPTPFTQADGSSPKGHILAVQQAVGVSALIAPWNFPLAMITRKVGPALAVGCTAVAKTSELTPLSAIALKNLADRAGIPPGVFELITANTDTTSEVGTEFCTNPLVKKISFTGSTRVGKLLMKQASDTVKRVSMELGGNAVFVVFADADIDLAVNAALASKFRNAGQTCVCADRFLVNSSVHDEFVTKLAAKVRSLRVGPGIQPKTQMGPLISEAAKDSVAEKVASALDDGAILFEESSLPDSLGPNFYPPTILTNVSPTSDIWKTETFGPVAAIMSFETEEEALEIANDCSVGLASYFCTKDLSRAFRFSHKLEAGMVGVNEGIMSTAVAPFGGVKESGVGTEGSHLGIKEYLETKYIFMNT